MNAAEQQKRQRSEYIASLHVASTRDEFGKSRFFVEDMHGDWIEGPFDSADLALAHIAACQTL